jgi:choline monooxygenase
MERKPVPIDENIRCASTMEASFYSDESAFALVKEKIFARSWQFLTDTSKVKAPGQCYPITLLEGFLDEPLLLTRDSDDKIHCLSNVCTHRGNLLVEGACHVQQTMRCRYHGRRFALDGGFVSAPGFEDAERFPSPSDALAAVPSGNWQTMLFASATTEQPLFALDELVADMDRRLSWLPMQDFIFDASRSRDYLVRANWALYCENYLEGFHIPYVHPDLAVALDTKDYRTEVFKYSNLQIGIANSKGDAFDLPKDSPDRGSLVAAYYYWLFPNLMFNFYPWGLSINVVVPLAKDLCRVQYLTYVWDGSKLGQGAGAAVDKVEREDEDIVEKVQKGVKSRFYKKGRYSPFWERGVHHFHSLLTDFI